jgi:hypothetical protein
LADLELELATLLSELHLFERRYLREVGVKYAELDRVRARIAELQADRSPENSTAREEATEARARAEESSQAAGDAVASEKPDHFEPSPSLKKLFRDVAKKVHPDLADNDQNRASRTRLMAEANAAYEAGDQASLQSILREWERSPDAVQGDGAGAELVRVIRMIARVNARIEAIGTEFSALKESTLWTLKVKVEHATADDRDLLAEMAAEVEEQIAEAQDELSRITAAQDLA